MLAVEVPLSVLVLGAVTGVTYGLLAAGLVLVHRTSGVINFAHGQVGLFGAAVFLLAFDSWNLPYYAALPFGLAAAAGAAGLSEVVVVRRLRSAPPLMSIVATLGVGQFLLYASGAINPSVAAGSAFPSPPGLPEFDLGALRMTQAYVGMLVLGPLAVIGLAVFLRRTRFGLAIRSAASNAEAARLAGISVARMSSTAWGLAGLLSGLTAVLVIPTTGFSAGDSFGPSLLLRALAGAVIARLTSLPVALAAGVGLGVVEGVLTWNYPTSNVVDVVVLGLIVVALLLQRGLAGRREARSSGRQVTGWRPVPEPIAKLWEVRAAPWALGAAGLALALALPLWVDNDSSVKLAEICCFAIVGLSVSIVTGLGGQLSLGQFGIAALGAVASYKLTHEGAPFVLALVVAGVVGALGSLAIGIPALRIRGAMLTVTTLAFAVTAQSWLLRQPWALGDGVEPGRPIVFGTALESGRSYYLFTLGALVLVLLLVRNVRRGGVGRRLVAVRDNEDGARAFAVSARVVKVQGFLLAGFIAGVGGSIYGHLLARLGSSAFPVRASIDAVAMAVIGGTSLLVGPVLGALYIIGVPAFLPLDSAGLAATQLGWLVLVLYLPGGLSDAVVPARRWFLRWAAGRHGLAVEAEEQPAGAPAGGGAGRLAVGAAAPRPVLTGPVLEAIDLHKSFGGVAAVSGVSFEVQAGEIVGMIGPNGAGKTTTFEILGGFTRPDSGTVCFQGADVTKLPPDVRAQRGLIRSFQDAGLFPSMTVLDAARLSFERVDRTRTHAGLLGLTRADREKDRRARELLGLMGLERYQDKRIVELSTGTRRITELACLIALEPTVLLLDEPSSGIAQRETEALGGLLLRIRSELDLTMVVIEHDIPLIMGLSDRIVAMESGAVLVAGEPQVVRHDPRVVESYLGGDLTAIERSDALVRD